jgi:hypothetical protein
LNTVVLPKKKDAERHFVKSSWLCRWVIQPRMKSQHQESC